MILDRDSGVHENSVPLFTVNARGDGISLTGHRTRNRVSTAALTAPGEDGRGLTAVRAALPLVGALTLTLALLTGALTLALAFTRALTLALVLALALALALTRLLALSLSLSLARLLALALRLSAGSAGRFRLLREQPVVRLGGVAIVEPEVLR